MQAVSIAAQTGIPVILWGDPGTGKTSFINTLGRAMRVPVEVVIASIREPSDFGGLPVVTNGAVKLAPPSWAVRLSEAGEGLLFLDEIAVAPPAVQVALLRVVLDKVVGDLPLPDKVAVVAAANPPERSSGWDLSPPLANRFIHIQWRLSVEDWCQGMISGWKDPTIQTLPKDWRKEIPLTSSTVASFIQRRPELLSKMPRDASQAGKAWPSPRSWENLAICEAACRSISADPETVAELVSGCVGFGPAHEYIGWLEEMDLPDPRDVLANPGSAKLPEEDDRMFAVLNAVVSEAVRELTRVKWAACWQIMGRAAKANKADLAAVAVRVLVKNRATDMSMPEEIKHFLPLLKTAGLVG